MNTAVNRDEGEPSSGADTSPADSDVAIAGSKSGHFAGAAVVVALGISVVISSSGMGYWDGGPGAGFFPLWMGVLLTGLAVSWAVQTVRAASVPGHEKSPDGGTRQMLLVLAGLAAVVLLLDVTGYQLTMFAFVLYMLLVVSRRRWLESLIFATTAGFGVYALFANVLQVFLPTASLGFLTQLGL